MNNIESFVFFDSTSVETTSNILYNHNNGDQLTVQVSGGGSYNIKFQGKSDYDSETFSDLMIIDMKTAAILQNITADGIYCVPLTSITQCKAVCSSGVGTAKVFGMIAG